MLSNLHTGAVARVVMCHDNPGALEAEAELPGQDSESKSQGQKWGRRKKRKPKGQGFAQRHMQLPRVDSEPDSFDLLVPLHLSQLQLSLYYQPKLDFLLCILHSALCPISLTHHVAVTDCLPERSGDSDVPQCHRDDEEPQIQ